MTAINSIFNFSKYLEVQKEQKFCYSELIIQDRTNSKIPLKNQPYRIIKAFSMALWTSIVKTIYYLAKIIFFAIPSIPFDRGLRLKQHTYTILRNWQQAYGHFLSIFNRLKGLSHINEAKFHIDCYATWTDSSVLPNQLIDNSKFSENDLHNALTETLNINSPNKQTSNCIIIAKRHIHKHEYFEALNALSSFNDFENSDFKEEVNELFKHITDQFIYAHDYNNAFSSLRLISETNLTDIDIQNHFKKIAEHFIENGNCDKATICIDYITDGDVKKILMKLLGQD